MNSNHSTHSQSRAEYWQQQVNAWSQTKLSGAQFCQSQGLVYHQFVYWRQKILKSAKPKKATSSTNGFSQVNYQTTIPKTPSGLTLSLPNGIEMHGIDANNISVVQTLLERMS